MKRFTEYKRKLAVLLIIVMLISGQAGLSVSAWAADGSVDYSGIIEGVSAVDPVTEETLQDEVFADGIEASENADELIDEASDVSDELNDIEGSDGILAETVSDNLSGSADMAADELVDVSDEAALSETAGSEALCEAPEEEAGVSMNIVGGMAQPIVHFSTISENYSNIGSDILRFAVYVETDYDTDKDGYNDLVQAVIQVPRAAAEGNYKAPTIFEASPYFAGTESNTGFDKEIPAPVYDAGFNEDELYQKNASHTTTKPTIKTTELVDGIENGTYPNLSSNTWHYKYENTPKNDKNYYLDGVNNHDYFLIRGFAVVVSAGLGTNGSDGLETCGSKAEVEAFKDIVEWIHGKSTRKAFADRNATIPIKADWANGNVAMNGCSYNGTMAYEVAATGVEGLKTVVPEAAISSWYEYSNTQGVSHFESNTYTSSLAGGNSSRFFGRDAKAVSDNILRNLCSKLFGYFDHTEQELAGHYGSFWEKREFASANNIKASALIVQGFNDYNVRTKQADLMRKAFENNDCDVRMILHQDGHNSIDTIQIGDMYYEEILNKWYCHYLLGTENDILDKLPKVYAQSNVDGEFYRYDEWYVDGWNTDKDKHITLSGNGAEITLLSPKTDGGAGPETPAPDDMTIVPGNDFMTSGDDPYYTIDDFFEGLGLSAEGTAEGASSNEKYWESWAKRVPSELTIQGKAEVKVRAKVPELPAEGKRMVLGAYLYDISDTAFPAYETDLENGDNLDTVTYIKDGIERGTEWGLYPYDLNVYKKTNVKKKLISKGVIDLGSPDCQYEPWTAVSGNITANSYGDYTIHMLPTIYTVEPGHYLWLYLIGGMDGINSDVSVIVDGSHSEMHIPVSSVPKGFNDSDFTEECEDDPIGKKIIEKVGGKKVSEKIIDVENKVTSVSSNIWLKGLDAEYIYMGTAVKPEIEVYDGTDLLTPGKDYRVSYSRNGKPTSLSGKDAVLTVTFKGEYVKTQKIVKTFKIAKTRLMDKYPEDDPDLLVADAAVAYTGRNQKPVPEIRYSTGNQKVISKSSFKYTYKMVRDVSGNDVSAKSVSADHVKDPGEYEIIIEPKNDKSYFYGRMTANLKVIKDKNLLLKNAKVEFNPKSYVYTGEGIMPEKGKYTLKLKLDGRNYTTLSENSDFEISLSRNNIEPGNAQIVFKAKEGNKKGLVGSVTGTFRITKGRDFNGPSKNAFTYNYENYVPFAKSGAVPSWITVKDGETELVMGRDYSVSYKDHRKLSTGSVKGKLIIKGKGKYKGTVTKEYDVITANIAKLNISVKDKLMTKKLPKGAAYRYEEPVITVTDEKGKKLTKGKDYKIKKDGYETLSVNGMPVDRGDDKPGMIRVTIEGMGNYFGTGTADYMYYDSAHGLNKVTVMKAIEPKSYTGMEIELTDDELKSLLNTGTKRKPGTDLVKDKDFYVESYKNNIKTGTAKVVLRGKGVYGGTKTISFKITRRNGKDFLGMLRDGKLID